jgi:hypothetical protein
MDDRVFRGTQNIHIIRAWVPSLPLFKVVRLSSTVRTYHDDLQGNPVNVVAAALKSHERWQ